MNTYQERKNSGVEWLGEIPRHWRSEHLKRFAARIQTGVTPPTDTPDYYLDGTVPWFAPGSYDGDLELREPSKLINEVALHNGAIRMFPAGTVFLIGIGATIGKVGLITEPASCNQQIIGITCNHRLNSRYLAYQLKIYEDVIPGIASGTTLPIFDQVKTGYLPVLQPPLPEQERIAAYLDVSCAAIDAAVAAKRRQIETLDALRKSIIHSLFADQSDVSNKRIKDVAAKITSGVTPDGGASGYLDSGIPLLRSQNVHFAGLRLDDVAYISAETHAGMSGSQLKPRDVLLNITGASIGRCAFVPDGFGEGNVNQHVCIIRPGPCIDHRFLASFLSSPMGQDQILSTFTGASRQGLSHNDLGLIRIPLPKIKVQQEAVAKIEWHDGQHDQLHRCIEAQITTLTAYRKSLIHECVTGQRRITEADVARVRRGESESMRPNR